MRFTKKIGLTPDIAINNMVLFGLILVVGMVVDGCIIVGENIYRHRETGASAVQAAKRGVHEVSGSLITAYLTTFAAFAPMFLVRGIMGDFLKLLPTVVLFALCAAMLVDHFLLPVLSVYFMKLPASKRKAAAESAAARQDTANNNDNVEDDEIHIAVGGEGQEIGEFPLAHEGTGVDGASPLAQDIDHLGTGNTSLDSLGRCARELSVGNQVQCPG